MISYLIKLRSEWRIIMKKLHAIFLALIMTSTMSISTAFAVSSPRIDHFGGTKWDAFYAVSQTADGGYVAVGHSSSKDLDMEGLSKGRDNAVIVKYSPHGVQEWVTTFGGSKTEAFYDVKQTSDGGYIAVGCSSSLDGDMAGSSKALREEDTGYSNQDAVLVKFDSIGKMEWFRDFGGSGLDRYNSIIETREGNYLAVGETFSWDGDMEGLLKDKSDCLIAMYDPKGTLMWFNNFGNYSVEGFNSVVECPDGSFVAVGYTNDRFGYMEGTGVALLKGLIVKFDSNQNIIWVKAPELINPEIKFISYPAVYGFTDVAVTKDGGYIVSGAGIYIVGLPEGGTHIFYDARIFKYDGDGNKEWDRTYLYEDYTNFKSVSQASDGGYIGVGYSFFEGPTASIAVKYDENGKLQWAKNDAGVNNGRFDYIEPTDKGYVVVGSVLDKEKHVEGLLYLGNFEESEDEIILSPENTMDSSPIADTGSAPISNTIFNTSVKAAHNVATVTVNGIPTSLDAYSINGNNYFKLRDLAQLLNRSNKKFSVDWDGAKNAISLTSGKDYIPEGGELKVTIHGSDKWAEPTTSKIYLNGKLINLTAYAIDGNNYFKLRDVASAMNFGVGWDGTTNTITINTNIGYTN